jgi:hypothetical protein
MQKQRPEHDQGSVPQNRNRQVEVFVSSDRFKEMKDKGGQTEGREVQNEWCATALLEDHKETHKQPDQAQEVKIDVAGNPCLTCIQVAKVGIVVAAVFGIGGPIN